MSFSIGEAFVKSYDARVELTSQMPLSEGTDLFNRLNSAQGLGLGWEEVSAWSNLQVLGLRAAPAAIGIGGMERAQLFTRVVTSLSQYAEVGISFWTGTAIRSAGVVLRGISHPTASAYICMCFANHATGITSQIYKIIGTSTVVLASESLTAWVAGDTLRGEIENSNRADPTSPPTIRLKRGTAAGVTTTLLTYSDTAANALRYGYTGLQARSDGAVTDVLLYRFKAGSYGW